MKKSNGSLVRRAGGDLGLGLPGKITRTGWELPKNLPEEDWVKFGLFLNGVEGAFQWWLGDWWAHGEHTYGERKALFEEGGPLTEISQETVRQYGRVSRKVESGDRSPLLTWKHHFVVVCADLTPTQQRRWLSKAEKEGWSAARLRRELSDNSQTNGTSSTSGADNSQSNDQTSTSDADELESSPENKRDAYLTRVGHAIDLATYSGPIDDETIEAACQVAEAWTNLANNMRHEK